MRFVRMSGLALAVLALMAPTESARSQDDPGLKMGQEAPEFTLKDQEGKERSSKEFLKDGKLVALVFYRSADW